VIAVSIIEALKATAASATPTAPVSPSSPPVQTFGESLSMVSKRPSASGTASEDQTKSSRRRKFEEDIPQPASVTPDGQKAVSSLSASQVAQVPLSSVKSSLLIHPSITTAERLRGAGSFSTAVPVEANDQTSSPFVLPLPRVLLSDPAPPPAVPSEAVLAASVQQVDTPRLAVPGSMRTDAENQQLKIVPTTSTVASAPDTTSDSVPSSSVGMALVNIVHDPIQTTVPTDSVQIPAPDINRAVASATQNRIVEAHAAPSEVFSTPTDAARSEVLAPQAAAAAPAAANGIQTRDHPVAPNASSHVAPNPAPAIALPAKGSALLKPGVAVTTGSDSVAVAGSSEDASVARISSNQIFAGVEAEIQISPTFHPAGSQVNDAPVIGTSEGITPVGKDTASTTPGNDPEGKQHLQSGPDQGASQNTESTGNQPQAGVPPQSQSIPSPQPGPENHGAVTTDHLQNISVVSSPQASTPKPAPSGDNPRLPDLASAESRALPAQPIATVNTARLIQTMGQSEMRVGLQSIDFGNISISTSATKDLISAQISLDHGDLARTLVAHLPEIQAALGSDRAMEVRIDMNGQSSGQAAGTSTGMSGNSAGSNGERQQWSMGGTDQDIKSLAGPPGFISTAKLATGEAGLYARLDIMA